MFPPNYDRAGLNAGYQIPEAPRVTQSVPPVGIALEQLEKELHHLREGVSQLNQRLSVVMRPIPASDSGPKPLTAGGSPMVNHVDSLAQLTRLTSAEVFAMLDFLEL
jgi:hypothetical protein